MWLHPEKEMQSHWFGPNNLQFPRSRWEAPSLGNPEQITLVLVNLGITQAAQRLWSVEYIFSDLTPSALVHSPTVELKKNRQQGNHIMTVVYIKGLTLFMAVAAWWAISVWVCTSIPWKQIQWTWARAVGHNRTVMHTSFDTDQVCRNLW